MGPTNAPFAMPGMGITTKGIKKPIATVRSNDLSGITLALGSGEHGPGQPRSKESPLDEDGQICGELRWLMNVPTRDGSEKGRKKIDLGKCVSNNGMPDRVLVRKRARGME